MTEDEIRSQRRPTNFVGDERCYTTHFPVWVSTGSRLTKSNMLVFLKECAHLDHFVLHAQHFAMGKIRELFVHRDQLRIPCELLERLETYPALDDDDYERRISDDAKEAWEEWGQDAMRDWVRDQVGAYSLDFLRTETVSPQFYEDGDNICFYLDQMFEELVRKNKPVGRLMYMMRDKWPIEYVPGSLERGDAELLIELYKLISAEYELGDLELAWTSEK